MMTRAEALAAADTALGYATDPRIGDAFRQAWATTAIACQGQARMLPLDEPITPNDWPTLAQDYLDTLETRSQAATAKATMIIADFFDVILARPGPILSKPELAEMLVKRLKEGECLR